MLQNIAKLNELVTTVAATTATPPAVPQPGDFLRAVQTQLEAMAKHLKEDEDLGLFAVVGPERLRVFDVEFTAPDVAVLHGIDPDGGRTTALLPLGHAQFLCRVLKMKMPAKRRPVGFHFTR